MLIPHSAFRLCGAQCLVGILLISLSLGGCASTRTAQEVTERTRALGTWEYRTQGIDGLQRGTLQIVTRDGDVIGRFRDQWRGQFEAEIQLQGTRMVIEIDRLRITGEIMDDQFTGTAQAPTWDVTHRSRRRQSPGRFAARRIRQQDGTGGDERFGCPSLLRETSYACSPFQVP
jgi:hypothetical protein